MSRVATPPSAKPVTAPPATAQPMSPTTSTPPVPREKIAMRAYEKWMKGGCAHGCDTQHWMEAEAELKAEMNRTGAPHTTRR